MEKINRQSLTGGFFLVCLVYLVWQSIRMLSPFFGPILAAVTLAIACYPLYQRLGKAMRNRYPTLQAFFAIGIIFLFIFGPLTFIVSATVSETRDLLPTARAGVTTVAGKVRTLSQSQGEWRKRLPPRLMQALDSGTVDIETRLHKAAESGAQWLAGAVTGLAKDALSLVLNLVLVLVLLFFFFKDGGAMADAIEELLPMAPAVRKKVFAKIEDTVVGVVRGSIAVAVVQGTFGLLGYWIAGTQGAVLLGCMIGIASFIPVIGAGLVWIPVCAFQFVSGSVGTGFFLLIWGVVLGALDNVVRPLVVGSKVDLPFLWLALSLFGGLTLFGFKGLLLGPLIFSLLSIFLELLREQLADRSS